MGYVKTSVAEPRRRRFRLGPWASPARAQPVRQRSSRIASSPSAALRLWTSSPAIRSSSWAHTAAAQVTVSTPSRSAVGLAAEEIAAPIVFLLDPSASWVNGVEIVADGGLLAAREALAG